MIVCRTPLRVSFLGGGSDLPLHYRRYGGAVLSAAISKYVYVAVNQRFEKSIRLSYSVTEVVSHVNEIKHKIVRASLEKLEIDNGIEITSIADIPSRGTGLGSSSAFTTALLHALHAFRGNYRSRPQLAEEACEVEIGMCGEPIGKQDQYASALGGVNLLRFNQDDSVTIEPIIFSGAFLREFQDSMLLFYTGVVRSASSILREQMNVMAPGSDKSLVVCRMAEMTEEFRHAVQNSDLGWIGQLLHEGWIMKQSLTDQISTRAIDDMYESARREGALGGKLLGAGGGGFLLICAPPKRHEAIRKALGQHRCLPFRIDWAGTSIILYSPQDSEIE